MKGIVRTHARWATVVAFAIGMAWVESACVYYIRMVVDRVVPYQADPLPFRGNLGAVELVREAATLVMLLTVGVLAGRTWRSRLGYASVAFGVWDIFYYLFLRLMSGWPRSIFDWDVLFLLPLPWWGPVIAPAAIALLMIAWGALAIQSDTRTRAMRNGALVWTLNGAGVSLALYVFMADSIRQFDDLRHGLPYALPTDFNWRLFAVALLCMSLPFTLRTGSEGGTSADASAEPARI